MTEPIGYAALQLIPSLDGFSAAVDKQLGGTLKIAGRKGGKEWGAGIAAGVKSSEADVKKAFDNHAKLADKAADATDKLKVAQAGYDELVEKGITKGKRYEAAIAAKNKAARDEARAVKAATDALKDYQKAAEDAKSSGEQASTGFLAGLRGSARGAGEAGSNAAASFAEGFAGSSALLRLGSAGGPVGIAVAAAGVALGGLLWQNIQAGIEREPGRDLVQARLGASDAEIARLGRISGEVYANNFGESRDQALRAGQLAIQGGLVADAFDPALQQVSERLLATSQLIGSEVEETAKSASILFRSGMADSAEQAFDIITKGYQVTGDLGADWLDSLGEYSSGWKNAGLTAQQALALIKQAQDNGVDVTDRSADALREFGRRVTEEGPKMVEVLNAIGLNGDEMYAKFKAGGPAAFEAFDEVFDKIRSIQDPVERNQAAMALLGDTAGDFIGSFTQWDPSSAVNSLGEIDGAARRASDTMGDNVAGSFESAQREIEVALDSVQSSLAEAFGPTLQEAAGWVKENNTEIADTFFAMGEAGVQMSQAVLAGFSGLVGGLSLFGQALGDSYGWVMRLGEGIAKLTGDDEKARMFREDADAAFGFGEGLRDAADAMFEASKNGDLLDSLRRARDRLKGTEGGADDAADAVGGLGDEMEGLGDSVNKLPSELPPWFKDLATGKPGDRPILAPGSDPFAIPGGPGYDASPGNGNTPAPSGTVIPGPPGTGGIGLKSFSTPLPPAGKPGAPYGLPAGTDIRQGASGFPDWVYQVGEAFGLKASTYSGHQEDRGQGNQGIDWWGPVENQQAFADFLAANAADIPGLEDVIWQNPKTGKRLGVNQGRVVGPDDPRSQDPGYFRDDWDDHNDHVHTTQSAPIPLPSGAIPATKSSGYTPAAPTAAPAPLSANSSPDEVSAAIIGQAKSRGFNREQTIAVLSTAMQESGLNPTASGGGGAWHGIFQQDSSYPGRDDPNRNISEFFERLGAPSDDIWKQIFGLQQGTGYDSSGARTAYLSEIQSQAFRAEGVYDRLAGSSVAGPYGASGPLSPDLINAFGAGYKPGVGTPGYNEYGEPGYYETDPRQIAQAQRSVEDSRQRIADTETAITDADASLAEALEERDRIAQMTEVERVTAGEDLDKANADVDRAQKQLDRARLEAQRAKEDAQWVQEDLQEAMQGRFSPAKTESGRGGKGTRGGDGFSLPTSLSGIGSAIGEFAGGQIGSALEVFGVNDSPGWLQAASTFLGGISVSDANGNPIFDGGNIFGGGSAAPLSAMSPGMGVVPPDDAGNQHGTRAGQAPGPVYNIRTATVEDAFVRANRLEREKAATKLARY